MSKAQPNTFALVLLIIAICSSIQGFGQMEPFLLLEKPGTKSRIRYYVGDPITFRPRYQKNFNEATIVGLSDSSIFVNQQVEFLLPDIEALADKSKVKSVHKIGVGTLLAIPAMFVFSAANNAFNTGRSPLVDKEVYALAGVFAVIGGACLLYKGKKYKMDGRWRLIVVHH
jgi:hypothetical protein